MTPTVDPADAERKARQLVDHRMAAVRTHAAKVQARSDREEEVEQAKRDEHDSWKAALGVGWTEEEMRKMGFVEPDKPRRSPRRGAGRGSAATSTAPVGAPGGAPERP